MRKTEEHGITDEIHPHDRLMEFFPKSVKNLINQLYKMHVWPIHQWSDDDYSLFKQTSFRNRREVIIPDIRFKQLPTMRPLDEMKYMFNGPIRVDTYYTWHPILFFYKFINHNNIVLYKIQIAIWSDISFENFGDIDAAEISMEKFEYIDEYLRRLFALLEKLPDLRDVHLYFHVTKYLLLGITENSEYIKIPNEIINNLNNNVIKEIKLNNVDIFGELDTSRYDLDIVLKMAREK